MTRSDFLKKWGNNKEREEDNSSFSSYKKGDARRLYNETYTLKEMSRLAESGNEALSRATSRWNNPEDMESYTQRATESYSKLRDLYMQNRDDENVKNAFNAYHNNYQQANLNNTRDLYSQYINEDAFNKARRTWELDEKYKGKSYEDIRKAYDTSVDQDEKDYLKNYTKYSSLADFDKALADNTSGFDRDAIKNARSNFATMNAFDEYKDLMNRPDYMEKSDAARQKIFNAEMADAARQGGTKYDKSALEGIDKSIYRRGAFEDLDNNVPFLSTMTNEDMQRVGALIYEEQGADAYKEFMKKVAIQSAAETSAEQERQWADWANQHPVIGTVVNTVSRPFQSAGATIEAGAALLTGNEYNPFQGMAGWGRQINESQKNLSEKFANNFDSEIGQTLARIGYNAATEGITSRLGQMATGQLYNLVMGGGVLAQTYGDALLSGMSKEKALGKAVAAGAIETATEAFGMERAFKWIPDKTWWSNMLSQGLAEGSEEVVGNIANAIYDQLANGKNSELQGEYQRLLTQGYSEKDAIKMTAWKFTLETLEEAGTAALSAGLSGGAQAYNTSKLGKNVDFSRLAEAINTYNPDSEAAQLYNKLLGGYTEESKVPAWNKGMVAQQAYSDARTAYDEAVESGDAQAIDNALMNRYALDEAFKTREEIAEDRKNNLVNRAVQSVRNRFQKDAETTEQTAERTENGEVVGGGEQSTRVSEDSHIAQEEMQKALNQSYRNRIAQSYTELENQLFDTSVNEEKLPLYKANFDYVVNAAHRQTDLEEVLQHVTPSVMKHSAAIDIYNAIRANDAEVGRIATEANSKVISKWDGEYSKKGLLTVNVDKKDLTKEDKRILGLVTALTHMGMDINVIKDKSQENGWVTDKDNKITLNLAAQYFQKSDPSKGRYVVNTLAHESTHWMENVLGKAEFGNFKNLIRSSVGVNEWNQMVGLEIARAKESGEKMDIDTAESEATARFCEDMLNDMTVADKIFQTASHSQLERIANAVKEFFNKIRNDLKEWMKGYDSMSNEARLLRQLDKSFKEVQDQWAEMFKRALAVNQVADTVKEAVEDVTEDYTAEENEVKKFSTKVSIESTEQLMARHNVGQEQLLKTIKLGGFALPSIAIMKKYTPHDRFGDCTVVFAKATIDPRYKKNPVYSGDAYTPIFPTIDKKISRDKQQAIEDKVEKLVGGRDIYYKTNNTALDYDNMTDQLNRFDVVSSYGKNDVLRYAFLQDTGNGFEMPMIEKEMLEGSGVSNNALGAIALTLGDDVINEMHEGGYRWYEAHPEIVDHIRLALNEAYIKENPVPFDGEDEGKAFKKKMIDQHYHMFDSEEDGKLSWHDFEKAARAMYIYRTRGAIQAIDTRKFESMVKDRVDQQAYEKWLTDLFDGIIEKEGIRNDKDIFTASGNRRSWEALHDEVNLENVVKRMLKEEPTGIGMMGSNIFGASTKKYSSIEDIRKDIGRLMVQDEKERDRIRAELSDQLHNLIYEVVGNESDTYSALRKHDDVYAMFCEAIRKSRTVEGVNNYLQKESKGFYTVKDDVAPKLLDIVKKIEQMPTEYFEAKPTRAVDLSEIAYVVVPSDANKDLIKVLKENNIAYRTYEKGNNEDRLKVINENASVESGTLFSRRVNTPSDVQGRKLSEQQVKYFEKSAIRDEDGNLLVVRHGTKDMFTIFNPKEKGGQNGSAEGFGIYFSDDPEVTNKYGDIQLEGYLNITKPAYDDKKTITRADLKKLIEATVKAEAEKWEEDARDTWISNYVYTYDRPLNASYGMVADQILKLNSNDKDIIQEVMTGMGINSYKGAYEFYDILANTLGFDGFIVKWHHSDGESNVFVAFNSSQFKDINNKNPTINEDIYLSRRVNDTTYDILKQNKRLEKDNAILKTDIKNLKKLLSLQGKVTKGEILDEKKLTLAAKTLLNEANSKYTVEELTNDLRELYGYIIENSSKEDAEIHWDEIMERAFNISSKVLGEQKPVKWVDDYYNGILKEIRSAKIKLTETQKQEAKNAFGDNYRSSLFGRIFTYNKGRSLDSYWSDWAASYPDVFEEDVAEGDQITRLSEIYDSLNDSKEVLHYFNSLEDTKQFANEIYNKFWTVSTLQTVADKYEKEINKLKFEHRQAMSELKDSKEKALSDLRKKKNDIIKQIREARDHKLEEYKMYRDWQEAEHKQRAEKKAYVEKITDTATTLMDWLKRNDGKNMKSVPDALKAPVTALLESIDFSSKQLLGMVKGKYSGMSTRRDRAIAESLNTIKDYMYKSRYNDTEDENYFDIPAEIVAEMEELSKALYQIAENNNGFVLNKMSTQELDALSNILTVLKTSITHINKRFNGKGEIDEVAIPDIVDNRVLGQKENNKFKAFFEWKNTLPQYAFEHLGKGATEMFQEIKDGWSKFAFHVQKIKDFAKETYNGEEYKKWSENVTEYTINGHKIKMTDTQRMSLYCLAKRDQALQHMFNGGIEVAPYRGKNGKLVEQAENVVLTQADIDTITKTLTDRQIEVAQALQNFMNTTCSDWMNEVTMKRWGIRGATEENYFPINVDDTSLVDTGEPKDMPKSIFKLLNMGFTKPLNEKATNPIVVDDIVNVFITHSTDMAKYNSLALPVLDMHRYYNFKMKTDEGDIYNMKKSIQTAYGRDAQSYITKFLLDLNANREESRAGELFKLAKGYKVAAVAGNLQVAALQPVAVMRAKMYLSNGDLIKGFTKVPEGVKEMLKYSGIAVWKDLSLFDTNVARGIDSQIKQNDSIKDKFVEKTMKLAELADKMTWGAIWSACKNEQYRNGLRGEELIKATAKEFETVIYHTQVVDSTMTRSEIMRGNDPYSQMVTSFMSEPTVSMNLLQDASVRYFQDARRYGKKEAFRRNGKHIARCCYIYALNAAVEAVLRGLMGKYRDWDEEPEEMLENMWKEFMMNLIPLSNLPIARDIVSKLQGYNVERMDMASWTSLVNAKNSWEKVVKGEKNLDYKTVYRTMQALSQFTGIPISSLMRDGAALWNDTVGQMYPSLKIE